MVAGVVVAEAELEAVVEAAEIVEETEVADRTIKIKIRIASLEPDIRTCHPEMCQVTALCTSDGGKVHFSVLIRVTVRGRTCLLQNLLSKIIIEELTSSPSIVTLNEYMTSYITNKTYRKYRRKVI